MWWYDMKWNEMICDGMWGFDGIWRGSMVSYIVLLHAPRKKQKTMSNKCKVLGGPWGLPFYSPQKLPSIRGSNSIGGCSPKESHKAKARKGTVEPASAASAAWAAETAVPNFITGICDDMKWNDMKWYVMIWWYVGIWWDLKRFDGVWWFLPSCSYMLPAKTIK